MRKTVITSAAILAALTFTGCRPPLILENHAPETPTKTTKNDQGPGPIRCFQAPCP